MGLFRLKRMRYDLNAEMQKMPETNAANPTDSRTANKKVKVNFCSKIVMPLGSGSPLYSEPLTGLDRSHDFERG